MMRQVPRTLLGRGTLRHLRGLAGGPKGRARAEAGQPAFVICGLEHSGTTLLSDLFRQVPGVGAGFETGVLLADRPSDFPQVQPHFDDFAASWGLGEADVAFILKAADFADFYRRLAERAGVLPPGATTLFDKTPRYMVALKACLGRVGAPFIATYKDPRAVLHSSWVRAGRPPFMPWLDGVEEETLGYLAAVYEQYQLHRMERRVLFLPLERLCLAAGQSCERAFDHVGLRFEPAYLVLRHIEGRATHGRSIQAGQPFTYRHELSEASCRAVERRFVALDEWFTG